MMKNNKFIFADRVVVLLLANPKGLSSYEIYNRLADDRRNTRWLPARNSIGSRLAGICGVENTGKQTGYSSTTSRQVVLWTLNIDRFNEWRNRDAR